MQIKSFFVALGLAAVANAAAIEQRQTGFKIRRFTPLAGFDEANPTVGTWSNNQYTKVLSNGQFSYESDAASAALFNYDAGTSQLATTTGVATNQQSYGITVLPLYFGGSLGEAALVTIGPAPLYEVKFQTKRSGNAVGGWTALGQVGSSVFLGKAADVTQTVRFRAIL